MIALLKSLQNLSSEQQVGLLFVLVFGVLLVTTIIATVISLNDRPPEWIERHRLFMRDLRAVWMGAVVFWLAWVSGPLGATLLFGLFSFLALREFITLSPTRRGDHRSLILAFFIV